MTGSAGTVYALHFDRPYRGKSQHYLGWTRDLERRLEMHRTGEGGLTTHTAWLRGIGFTLVATWPGTQALERRLKRDGWDCPLCSKRARLSPLPG
jgi:putative endonuclease